MGGLTSVGSPSNPKNMNDKFIKTGIVVTLFLLAVATIFIGSKLVEIKNQVDQPQEELVFGTTFVPEPFRKIETAADSTRPGLPYRVFRIKYLTYTLDTIGGEGLPTFIVKDRHYKEDNFGARGRFNWSKDLPLKEEDVLEIFGSPVFIGVQ